MMSLNCATIVENNDAEFFNLPYENLLDDSHPDWTETLETFDDAEEVESQGWTPSGSYKQIMRLMNLLDGALLW